MDHCLHICPSGALYKKFPLCHIPREASQCSFQMTWLLKVFHWGCFILLKERLQPCETVSQSGPMDSYYWTEHRLSFLFLWGVSLGLLLKLNKEKILCTFCTLCLFFLFLPFTESVPVYHHRAGHGHGGQPELWPLQHGHCHHHCRRHQRQSSYADIKDCELKEWGEGNS